MAVVTLPIGNEGLPRLPRPLAGRLLLVGVATLVIGVTVGRLMTADAPPATVSPAAGAAAPAVEPAYPYESTTRVGPWGFVTRHAGDYVAWRFFERDVTFSATMSGPSAGTGRFGDPSTWADHAAAIGFRVDAGPKPGAIAQWNAGEQGAGAAGHVAYVDRVNADGSVVVSEFDWSVPYGYSQRDAVRAPRYIHIQDL